MSTYEARLIAALAGQPAKLWFTMTKPFLFEDGDEQTKAAYAFCDAFARQHGAVPIGQTITEKTGLQLPGTPGEAPFLVDKLAERRVRRRMALLSEELQVQSKDDPVGALKLMHERSTKLMAESRTVQTYDFKQAILTLWPHLIDKWSGKKISVPLPWPTLDGQIGGLYGGEILSFIGRPGMGKSYVLLVIAHHIWRVMNQPVVFSTQEMKALKVMERLAAIHTKVPIDMMKDGVSVNFFGKNASAKTVLKKGLAVLEESGAAPFIVVDGGLAGTAEQLAAVCQMENPCFVGADGPYLFRAPRGNMKLWERVEHSGEVLKQQIATDLDVPVGATYQFNREGADAQKKKSKDGEKGKAGLEHIAGGDTVGQISSIVAGLTGAPSESKENVEMINAREGEILKGRDGESGTWRFRWDFRKMDFSELKAPGTTDSDEGLPVLYGV